jgi:ferric-dicitrate binding protein FerR (iron transport regulator)
MDEIIFRVLKGQATSEEEVRVRQWVEASLENRRQYQEIERVLRLTVPRLRTFSLPPDPRTLVALSRRPVGVRRFTSFLKGRRGIAAAIATMALAGYSGLRWWESTGSGPAYPVDFVTAAGESATVHTQDGSIIHLAPEAQLHFPKGLDAREVTLDGRAYFSISKRNGEPFLVHVGGAEVKVLGTRFDLAARGTDVRLIVVEGRVALTASGEEVEVRGGEMSEVVDGSLPAVMRVTDPREVLDWERGFIAFRDTPLTEVAHELELRYGTGVRVGSASLSDQTITAWFADRSLGDVVDVICQVLDDQRCLVREDTAAARR